MSEFKIGDKVWVRRWYPLNSLTKGKIVCVKGDDVAVKFPWYTLLDTELYNADRLYHV